MKPEMLVMQAFGPYLARCEVDFTGLEGRLFLICGATGGGKTSILDAISFALYCRATGGRRSWLDMRNLAAPDELPTLVEFTFCLGAERYRFCRSWRWHRVRGSGRREPRDEHECWRSSQDGWELLESGAESKVREVAERLLGLNCEQFSQVLVLPQGEFRKLLLSNSSEKARIFQTLFRMERWEAITKSAQQLAQDCKNQCDALLAEKAAVLRREEAENEQDLSARLAEREMEFQSFEERNRQVTAQLKEMDEAYRSAVALSRQFQEWDALEREHAGLMAQKEQMEALRAGLEDARRAQRLQPYAQELRRREEERLAHKKRLEAAQKEETAAKQALAAARARAQEIPAMREKNASLALEAASLRGALENARRLAEFAHARTEEEARLRFLEEKKQREEALQKAAEESLRKGEAYLREQEALAREAPALASQVERLEAAVHDFEMLRGKREELEAAVRNLESAARALEEAKVRLSAFREELAHAEEHRRANAAGLLAAELREGVPCPVCGATYHPALAPPADDVAPDRRIEVLRESVQKEEAAFSGALAAHARQAAEQESLQTACEELAARCAHNGMQPGETAQRLLAVRDSLQAAREAGERIPRAQQRLEQRMEEREQAAQNVEQCASQREECLRALAAARAGEAAVRDALPAGYGGEDALHKRLVAVQNEADALEEAAAQAREELAHAERILAVAEATRLAEETAEQATRDECVLAARRFEKETLAAGFSAGAEINALLIPQEEMQRREERLRDYDTRCASVQSRRGALAAALAGKDRSAAEEQLKKGQLLQEQARALSQQLGGARQRWESAKRSAEELKSINSRAEKAQGEYARAARVAQLIAGQNALKMPLRMYVLSMMLDQIVSYANQYFSTLSAGRYCLRRHAEAAGRGYSGLELTVLDAYCGGERAVDTLSGGELFLASLSLAFGLADVVQGYAGGVRLDSIFIDEGFGSLDQDTLEIAMKALLQVQRAGRTVGMISHVGELKSRIPNRIEVRRTRDGGSTVRVRLE
jgi:exonuclease SbcC